MKPHFTSPLVTLCKCCVLCDVRVLVWAACCHGDECRPATVTLTLFRLHSALRDEQITTAPLMRLIRTLQTHREIKAEDTLFPVFEHLIEMIGF